MEAASKPAKQMRWHPAVLRWAIAIHMKSASAYSIVREAGYLSLPHPSTLYKYTHFTNPHTGINSELLTKFYRDNNISSRKKHEKYVALLMDEMKISSGLAFSRSTGRLIGFCDIGSISSEMEDFEKRCTSDKTEPVLASHVLLFMARGITTSLKFPVAYYATASLKASQLHEMTYEVITALKLMDLTVLCLVSDGAASNRRLYQNLGGKGKTELSPAHFCWNWFGDEEKIFFICDVPHLLKTLRNNMENSNWSRKTRNLVFRGQKIQWTDLISFMEWDQGRHRTTPGLRFAPKLTHEHLYLTPGLRMKVRLAAQVMSNTVANGLELMKRKELGSAILFLRKVNKFFDCLNVARLDQGTRSRNENLKPYTSEDDPRFEWLLKDFLGFLTEWATEGETIEGLTKKEKAQLCISRQTIAGVYITVHSFTEIARKLLRLEGVRYVLSDKLNQDPIEEFFGKQRGQGGTMTTQLLSSLAMHMSGT
ncbi:hypothetical protein BSL78_27120 [Apostichopus japonicus]|uniref:Transposable element P transposase n=1 Tax=Stichopus japonicus TaxID=307972 RepID=A0A2G8JJZ7_STIJA|nr:hypothetical protein BSL78_27120 [Apostichopus japonicus]